MNKCIQALLILWLSVDCANLLAAPQWVAHASKPGPDLPPAGGSRFDRLFAGADNQYRIPFPFSELVALLESRIDNGRANGVRRVFVPMGRSLQRNAPAPDFFRLPREVIALQGEPAATDDVLEYRLFIAHQPGTGTLEVISYNDSAGRFEFQVVDDYTANRPPRVRQANRLLCMSCHQNAAPIFPTRPWRETSFNVEVASKLVAALPRRFESLVETLTDDAGAIDLLVERANYLAVAQLIWQQGCGDADCRAAALRAILQYRLSGKSSFAREHPAYRRDYYANLEQNWRRNWPQGLALANSRIVDRNPFAGTPLSRAEDALALRPAHATWHDVDAIVADGIIFRLGGFLTMRDIRRLDDYLVAAGQRLPRALERFGGNCRLANAATATRMLECSDGAATSAMQATIELDYDQGRGESLRILSLRVPGERSLLQPQIASLSRLANGLRAELENADSGLSMRLANGDRVASLELRWQDDLLQGNILIEIEVAREFQLIEPALASLLRNFRAGNGDALSARPFRREPVIAELDRALGPQGGNRGQAAAMASPAPLSRPATALDLAGDLALLQPFCGRCHAGATRFPPGFLGVDGTRRRVSQCAPRILARLAAWRASGEDAIVPMPPPATIDAHWASSNHYRRLVDAVETLLADNPEIALPIQTAAAAYSRLPPCLELD
jgi:hypothetical protein